MLPNPDIVDAKASKEPVHRAVACLVAAELGIPVCAVVVRDMAVLRTAMEEAPISKNGNTQLGKPRVRPPRDAVGVLNDCRSGEHLVKQGKQPQFRLGPRASDS